MGNILCCFKNDDDGSIQSDNRIEDEDCDRQPDIDQKDRNGETKLYKAAERGNIDECRDLLSRGANINCTDNGGASPLMIAAEKGHLPTCVLLTDSGADVDLTSNGGNTALNLAAEEGHHVVAQHLINLGADCNTVKDQSEKDDLLRYGSSVGDLTMCANLLMSGAATLNPIIEDEKLPLFISAKSGHYELSQWMIGEGADDRKCLDPLLYCYAKYGDYQLCRNMLERGADPSYPGCLQIAIDLYHTDVAQLLIDHPKAKVNQVRKCDFQ